MGYPGRQASVQSLVDEHYEALYRYAYRLSGRATDAEDLVQETYCKAQEKLKWMPRVRIADGLRLMVVAWRKDRDTAQAG